LHVKNKSCYFYKIITDRNIYKVLVFWGVMKNIAKPKFKETIANTIELDNGLIFNALKIGPMNFKRLRNANYGKGFRMPTMSELTSLIYSSLKNKNYDTAKDVIKTAEHCLTGNTGVLYVSKGMFVQDNPKLKQGKILMNSRTLERKLGKNEEKGVIFSDDKTIRFVPYGFEIDSQNALALAKNPGIIALTGSEENAEKFAETSRHYKGGLYLWIKNKIKTPETKVVGMTSCGFKEWLSIGAYSEKINRMFSFGILKDTGESNRAEE